MHTFFDFYIEKWSFVRYIVMSKNYIRIILKITVAQKIKIKLLI